MSKSPQYNHRHRSASIPVTPETNCKPFNARSRLPNGGYLSLPKTYPPLETVPRCAPEQMPTEAHPNQFKPRNGEAEDLSRRFSENLTVEGSSRRRRGPVGSPRHCRSLSFRAMKRPTQQQVQDDFRPRVSTMPSDTTSYLRRRRRAFDCARECQTRPAGLSLDLEFDEPVEDEYYLLRSFSITSKGIVNRGDLVRQRSRSNNSVASTASSLTGGASSATSCSSGRQSNHNCKVLILGKCEVGKTSLMTQFMTSEYMNAYDAPQEDAETTEKCVSVLLDGEEYELTIVDMDVFDDISLQMPEITSTEVDAYVVVYSVTDRPSFEKAVDVLFALRELGYTISKAVILVGNKCDLARSRIITTEEGKAVACSYECKFIETSAGIDHNVDELLVGLVSQIRLKALQKQEMLDFPSFRKRRSKGSFGSGNRARGLISRLLGKENYKSKSCDNLHVL
ncbi:GTP-binding protein RAD-like [Centruroides sculpturatus]|uniref:GTP-binding protein RAD-like n=1 Tax=Centruroides sculpturatus TaxID=218467 RepID=UPI000C6E7563|nr:GTP-binding protein RAD-like [Centruroides sculpturatus]